LSLSMRRVLASLNDSTTWQTVMSYTESHIGHYYEWSKDLMVWRFKCSERACINHLLRVICRFR
jgi:hypothetical protein